MAKTYLGSVDVGLGTGTLNVFNIPPRYFQLPFSFPLMNEPIYVLERVRYTFLWAHARCFYDDNNHDYTRGLINEQ